MHFIFVCMAGKLLTPKNVSFRLTCMCCRLKAQQSNICILCINYNYNYNIIIIIIIIIVSNTIISNVRTSVRTSVRPRNHLFINSA